MLMYEIKSLPGMEDADETVLNIYIKRAIYSIKNYLNNERLTDDDIKEFHSEAIVSMVTDVHSVNSKGLQGIKSKSQGARSITYQDNGGTFTVSQDIKALLPPPYIKMVR